MLYRADERRSLPENYGIDFAKVKWRSPIFMPRWASRLTLEITAVRCERLHAISEADAKAESVVETPHRTFLVDDEEFESAVTAFSFGWDGLNDRRAPWDSNPWVWVISFRRAS